MLTLLDNLLSTMRLQSAVFSRMTLAGDWGYAKDALPGAPFHLLLSGRAVVEDDSGESLTLEPGDMAVLPRGHPHRLLGRHGAPAEPWRTIVEAQGWTPWQPGTHFKSVDLHLGEGEPTATLISGVFDFHDPRRHPLLESLPPLLLLSGSTEAGAASESRVIIQLLESELLSGAPGAEPVCTRLVDMLFVQAVRQHIASPTELRGWLRGLASPDLAGALAAVHRDPAGAWTLQTMCDLVGMSRTRFAKRFRDIVDMPPMEYVTDQRMFMAAGLLDRGDVALPTVAMRTGYSSPITFSRAFQRWSGMKPSLYRSRTMAPGSQQTGDHASEIDPSAQAAGRSVSRSGVSELF